MTDAEKLRAVSKFEEHCNMEDLRVQKYSGNVSYVFGDFKISKLPKYSYDFSGPTSFCLYYKNHEIYRLEGFDLGYHSIKNICENCDALVYARSIEERYEILKEFKEL